MRIIIIGSGNVAYHLTKAFTENQIPLVQIFGRNEIELEKIASEFGIPFSSNKLEDADLYLISVSDNSVEDVSKLITNSNALVAHTSGSLPKEILIGNYKKASFYPLQTFSKNKTLDYSKIPFFIEAESETNEKLLTNLASKISENVEISTYEKRKYIHLTAIFACNFVNHLITQAKKISDSQDLPFEYFIPLIDETIEKIHTMDPKEAQTGPAVRGDNRILQLHENLINNKEQLDIYKVLNQSIKKMHHE